MTATVCSKSGKLPIAGVCDAYLKTEYFAEGTVPTETCDVHFSGMVCAATGLAATTACPYQVPGVIEIAPSDDGSPGATRYCPHTPDYFTNPANAASIQAAQQAIAQQQAAATQAAQQQAAQQAQQQQAAQQAQQQIDAQADAEEAGGGEAPEDDE